MLLILLLVQLQVVVIDLAVWMYIALGQRRRQIF